MQRERVVLYREVLEHAYDGKSVTSLEAQEVVIEWPDTIPTEGGQYLTCGQWKVGQRKGEAA